MEHPRKLGVKIREYRKRAGLSQMQLELEIGASNGSLSRIEKDEVNPTKETLIILANALKLTPQEKADLLNVRNLRPAQSEVQAALSEVEQILKTPGVIAYLVDDWWTVYALSTSMLTFMNLSAENAERLKGKNLLELIYDPQYGMRAILDPIHFVDNYSLETARAKVELNKENYSDYFESIVARLKRFPDFETILEASAKYELETVLAGARISYLIIGGQKIKLFHAREKLKHNPRFELVQLFNTTPYE